MVSLDDVSVLLPQVTLLVLVPVEVRSPVETPMEDLDLVCVLERKKWCCKIIIVAAYTLFICASLCSDV